MKTTRYLLCDQGHSHFECAWQPLCDHEDASFHDEAIESTLERKDGP